MPSEVDLTNPYGIEIDRRISYRATVTFLADGEMVASKALSFDKKGRAITDLESLPDHDAHEIKRTLTPRDEAPQFVPGRLKVVELA